MIKNKTTWRKKKNMISPKSVYTSYTFLGVYYLRFGLGGCALQVCMLALMWLRWWGKWIYTNYV